MAKKSAVATFRELAPTTRPRQPSDLKGGTMAKPKLGSGGRFKALESKLAKKPGVTNPAALAASIGRKKYGAAKFNKLAAKGHAAAHGKHGTVHTRGQ